MKKNFTFKFLTSLLILTVQLSAIAETYVSLSPALTETMYAIGADKNLKGVSTACTYPKEAQNKEKIGNSYFINEEKILNLHPDYILALDSSEFAINKFKKFNITPICFKYPNIDTIHKNILEIGKITGKEQEAKKLVDESKRKIALAKTNHPKKILYLVQTSPLISIGKKSFITDVIKKSGNISITENINTFYPTISEEYAIKEKPDIIVLGLYSDDKRIKKLFPNTKIVFMNTEENNIINRPGPRIHQSVEYFSKL